MSENIPYIKRLVELNALLDKKSHFLLGPRLTGKTFLIRHTLENTRVYDLLDSEIYLALSRNPGLISEELQPQDRIVVIDEIQRLPAHHIRNRAPGDASPKNTDDQCAHGRQPAAGSSK